MSATNTHQLTALPNHQALSDTLGQMVQAGTPVSLAMLDLDGFEQLNAQLGRETGDQVLLQLAALLRDTADVQPFHTGGDEFVLLLPGFSLEQAFLRMEQVRVRIEQHNFGLSTGHSVRATIGVAQFPRDAKDGPALLKAADAALYTAKDGGRNQVALALNEEMIMKTCYYPASSVRRLKMLAERLRRKESQLLREALDDLFRRYDAQ